MSMAELHDVHHMEGMGVEDHLNILQRFSIGWCRTLISNSSLAEEIRLEKDQQAYECREVGEKLPMEVSEVVGNGDMYDAEMDRVYGGGTSGVSWRGNILWEGQLHAPDVVTLVVQVDEQDANGETTTTVDFGKLLGAKTIGSEAVIVHDIAWILVQSQLLVMMRVLSWNVRILGSSVKEALTKSIWWTDSYHFEVSSSVGCLEFILQHGRSDHASVHLSSGIVDWVLKPFRILNCWIEKKGHVKLMESEWRRISEEFVSHFSIIEKLRLLKVFLELWTHESFGSVKLQIKVTMDLMNDLEDGDRGVEEQGELVNTRRQLQGNL
ncbi:hypothetical protein V6N13_115910 [Hibiscus sabdariffa]